MRVWPTTVIFFTSSFVARSRSSWQREHSPWSLAPARSTRIIWAEPLEQVRRNSMQSLNISQALVTCDIEFWILILRKATQNQLSNSSANFVNWETYRCRSSASAESAMRSWKNEMRLANSMSRGSKTVALSVRESTSWASYLELIDLYCSNDQTITELDLNMSREQNHSNYFPRARESPKVHKDNQRRNYKPAKEQSRPYLHDDQRRHYNPGKEEQRRHYNVAKEEQRLHYKPATGKEQQRMHYKLGKDDYISRAPVKDDYKSRAPVKEDFKSRAQEEQRKYYKPAKDEYKLKTKEEQRKYYKPTKEQAKTKAPEQQRKYGKPAKEDYRYKAPQQQRRVYKQAKDEARPLSELTQDSNYRTWKRSDPAANTQQKLNPDQIRQLIQAQFRRHLGEFGRKQAEQGQRLREKEQILRELEERLREEERRAAKMQQIVEQLKSLFHVMNEEKQVLLEQIEQLKQTSLRN